MCDVMLCVLIHFGSDVMKSCNDIHDLHSYRVVGLWKEKLSATNQKAAQSLADPAEYENLFPGLHETIQAEEALRSERSQLQPANTFPHITVRTDMG